ncbi:YueI family protein [Pelosinus propionicus]|uniref:Uncharacterized protein YueI n=1 Tax=Pelosinus propionicus DSM 13327 TaxID=1123291 RepID=A0A1I4KBK7_9FIRM|nr:YueI family protein [Pelosinus propionicus]SFL76011.1 Uncharacterized protein YueI [Pelosinus propionicus DSM 13327]
MVQKDKVEQALLVGLHGAPELKYDEKVQYLGEFRERIIRKLTIEQVRERAIYPEILQVLRESRASKLIINGNIDYRFIEKYKALAVSCNKISTVRSDPSFQGDTGLIVISDEAVDIQDIEVEDRSSRLRRLGIPSALIEAAGQKICKDCMNQLTLADENEKINYQQLNWMDRLSGDSCPGHK